MEKVKMGELIRERREFLKLTQVDLSEMSGITPRTINAMERGVANFSLQTLEKIGEVLGLEMVLMIKKSDG